MEAEAENICNQVCHNIRQIMMEPEKDYADQQLIFPAFH